MIQQQFQHGGPIGAVGRAKVGKKWPTGGSSGLDAVQIVVMMTIA
jgi:hypothetical protein